MRSTTKTSSMLVLGIIAVSLIAAVPGVMAAPPDATIISATGHSLTEDDWSIIYDFDGGELVKDFTPGPYAVNLSDGLTDSNTIRDSNFYVAYANMGQVQSLYIANENLTLDVNNLTRYGCAPYQLFIQHFRTLGSIEVFVINTFVGLLAYQEELGNQNGVPDKNDSMYFGWTAYSELFKHYANRLLVHSGIPDYNRFDPNVHASAEPIEMTKTVDGNKLEYRYGMSYKNLFVVWQSVELESSLNDSSRITETAILNGVVAFCMLDSLNFTYVMRGEKTESGKATNVTTTTEYQIGEINNLWVRDDDEGVADYFNGTHYTYNVPGETGNMTLYNTSESIQARLLGNVSTPGFGLAVANYVNLVVLGTKPPMQYLRDAANRTLENASLEDRNITRAQFMLSARQKAFKAFEIDYEGKDTYLLGDETTPRDAPSCIVRNTRIRNPMIYHIYSIAKDFIIGLYGTIATDFGVKDQLRVIYNPNSIFYLTCFPEWNGKQIINDPTFTAYAADGVPLFSGRQIPGSSVTLLLVISFLSIGAIIFLKRRKFVR